MSQAEHVIDQPGRWRGAAGWNWAREHFSSRMGLGWPSHGHRHSPAGQSPEPANSLSLQSHRPQHRHDEPMSQPVNLTVQTGRKCQHPVVSASSFQVGLISLGLFAPPVKPCASPPLCTFSSSLPLCLNFVSTFWARGFPHGSKPSHCHSLAHAKSRCAHSSSGCTWPETGP